MTDLPRGSALIIGIDDYANGISPLQSARRDARAIARELKENHSYDVTLMLDNEADADNIARHLEEQLPESVSNDSCFLFYYAGHGVARGDGDAGPQGFLIPHGAKPGTTETWLSMERVRSAISALPCKHLLVILDCCFAGSFRWSSTRDVAWNDGPLYDSQYERYLKGVAWQALTSASHDEKALDISPGQDNTRDAIVANGHSPFASALLRGLQGEADTARVGQEPDGVITATELYQFIYDELVPPDNKSHQTPGIWPLKPDNTGQYVFHSPVVPKNTLPDPPLDDTNNPWCGLRAYDSEDAPLFFGRQRVIDTLLERVQNSTASPLLVVVGASGTGKSSAVKAGLLPRLQHAGESEGSDKWHIVHCARLGPRPSDQLDAAITKLGTAGATQRRLLLIDQFEELFTQCASAELRDAFLTSIRDLIDDATPTTVVLTIRSDFEPRLKTSVALADLWANSQYLVPALTVEEFRDCIVGPAQVKALYFDPDDLIDEVLEEVMSMPGALPMLSFALSEMYRQAQQRRRDTGDTDRALTRADYDATGGVVGALHRRASELYDQSDETRQSSIRRIFLRMLAQDGARISRRRVTREELAFADAGEQARVDEVIEQYVAARLLVVDEDKIEPAHDTLIVAWEKLQDWLSEAGPQTLTRSLWLAARGWLDGDRGAGLLWYDNPQLPLALQKQDELNALEQRFVKASEKRRKRRRRTRLGIAATVLVTVLGFSGYGLDQALDAEQARHARDRIYLNIMEQGDFFDIHKVLPEHAQGGVVQPADQSYSEWRLLVDEPYCGYDAQGYMNVVRDRCPFVIGKVYGKGRVIAIGHEALITYIDWSEFDADTGKPDGSTAARVKSDSRYATELVNKGHGASLFLDLALQWLTGDTDAGARPVIMFSEMHEETLISYHEAAYRLQALRLAYNGYDVQPIGDLATTGILNEADALVIGNAWRTFEDAEMEAIEQFVANGGGLLMAGLGWSWVDVAPHNLKDNPERALEAYPMNQIGEIFNASWKNEPIWTDYGGDSTDAQAP